MAKNLEDLLAQRPGSPRAQAQHRHLMVRHMRAYRLRELRQLQSMTQTDVATALEISQRRVSDIENGDIDRTKVDTLRRYAGALGGTLRIEVDVAGETYELT